MDHTLAEKVVDSIINKEKVEGFDIDLVEGIKNPDTIGEKIAAFATSGGGWLIIGISSRDNLIVGIEDKQVLITKVGEVLRSCSPIPTIEEPQLVERGSKLIAVYRIPSLGGAICEYKETPYHRVQDSVKKMTIKELVQVLQAKGIVSWEERPSLAPIEAVENDELNFYLQKVNERNPLERKTPELF